VTVLHFELSENADTLWAMLADLADAQGMVSEDDFWDHLDTIFFEIGGLAGLLEAMTELVSVGIVSDGDLNMGADLHVLPGGLA
jgi:hypothetical protein